MKTKLMVGSLLLLSSGFMITAFGRAQNRGEQSSATQASINLNRAPENLSEFSLIISDGDEQVVSGTFDVDQLKTILEIMVEAKKFALSEEAVGRNEPITTRFASQQGPRFVVDVMKLGNSSQFFITYKTDNGVITVEAGTIYRNNKEETGQFSRFLSKVEAAMPKPVGQSAK